MLTSQRLLFATLIAFLGLQHCDAQDNANAGSAKTAVAKNQDNPLAKTVDQAKNKVAQTAAELLDQNIDLGEIDTTIGQLDAVLSKATKQPFFVDQRAVAIADLDNETVISGPAGEWPLRSSLRRLLRPYGLRAVIEEEGFVITADFAELTRRGIATDYWITSNPAANEKIVQALDQKLTVGFNDLQLDTALAELGEQTGIEIIIDRRALEEIGLTPDTPATARIKNASLRTILRFMLRELDLTYRIHDELMVITTIEACEQNLCNRVYFLEGTGALNQDINGVARVIQTTIVPETWEALGGPSTIAPMAQGDGVRPAIIVAAPSDVHEQIADLFAAMRKNHFGPDPAPSNNNQPSRRRSGVGMGGGGMGGAGGMGGGGMGGGGGFM
jgi:hypothetical protein